MENEMNVVTVPTMAINDPSLSPTPIPDQFSGKWEDMAKDMAAMAGNGEVTPIEVITPKQDEPMGQVAPVQTAQAPSTVTPEVPDKFKAPDCKLDEGKIIKSYLDLEKAWGRAQSAKNLPQVPFQQAQQQQVQPQATTEPQSFEAQVEQDLKTYGAGPVLARLFQSAREAARADLTNELQDVRSLHENEIRTRELQAIAKHDPFVFTEEGFNTLKSIRESRPWINSSPEPWKQAYREYLADKAMNVQLGNGSQVFMPNPKAVTAPVGPVTAANRAPQSTVKLETQADILNYVATLTKDQEAEFWRRSGFKWK